MPIDFTPDLDFQPEESSIFEDNPLMMQPVPYSEFGTAPPPVPFADTGSSFGEEMLGVATDPLLPFSPPVMERPSDPSVAGDVGRAAYNTLVKGTADFINTPAGVMSLGLGVAPRAIQRLAGLGFGAHMTKGAAETAGEASVTGDRQKMLEAGFMAAPVPFLMRPGVRFGENIALTPGDAMGIAGRDMARQVEATQLPINEAAPVRQLGVESPPINPFFNPGVRDLASRALEEGQGRAIIDPAVPPAMDLLRREFQPPIVEGVSRFTKEEPLGGQISFDAPAAARAVPSARQSAVEVPNAIQPEAAQPVRPVREKPIEGSGEVPIPQDRGPVDAGGGKGATTPQAEIDRFAAMDAAGFDKAIKESGIGVTSSAYRLAEKLTAADIPALEAAQKQAHAQRKEASKAAKTPAEFAQSMALGMKGQMFGEAIKWRKALDEARANNVTMREDFAALERKHGVGESDRFGGDLRAAYERELQARPPTLKETMDANAKQSTPGFTEINPMSQPVEAIKSDAVLSNKLGETSHESLAFMPDAELNKVFDARAEGGSVRFSPHTDGVAYGIKHPELIAELEHLRKSADEAFVAAAEKGDNAAYKANFGRSTWASGALEGARRSGPNYDLFIKTQEVAREKAAPIQEKEIAPMEVEGVTSLDPASGVPLSATDALINKLESLKFAEATEGRLYSLPHPDAIAQIGKTAWNNGIDVAIGAIRAGRSMKDAVNDAISYIKKNAKGFNESQVRQNLESILREETQNVAASGERGGRAPTSDQARKAPNEAVGVESENVRMRNLSARGTQAESIPASVQERIAAADQSFYNQQSVPKVVDMVRGFSDAQLTAVTPDSSIYTAAKMEQVNRLLDAGKNDAGYQIFQDLAENLTRLGQVINQAKLLQGLNPQNVVRVVNEGLKKSGRDPLTTNQAGELSTRSRKRIELERATDRATDEWVKNPNDANARAAEKALEEANNAALKEQEMVHQFQHRSMASLLKAILQGNLLTPISQAANVVGNMSFMPFRIGSRTGAAALDMITSAVTQKPRQITTRPITGTSQAVSGLIEGIKEIPGILAKGSGNVIKGESRAGLHPLKAWVDMFSKNPDIPTVGGKVPWSDRAKLAVEGTFGISAEAMLRGLAAGDAPFKSAARSRLIAEAAKLKNVPDSQLSMARKFPELFFDAETMKRIHSETARDIFQRDSQTLQHLTSLLGKKGGWFDLLVSTVAPYKVTPWNIIGEILSYNPILAAAKTGIEAKRGNRREAELSAAKTVVGGMLAGAGWWLYKNGLLAPSMDSRDEAQKARVLAGQVMPPNHINISGLKRAIAGGNPAFVAGDETRDVFRAGGLAGSMFYMTANIGRDLEKRPESDIDLVSNLLKDSVIEQARFGVNQSFLKGVAGALQSVTTGETDNFVQGMMSSVISIPLPNTLSVLSRSQRDYKVDVNSDRLDKEFENVVRTRLGIAGLDDYLPLKRGLWGEPLRETPKDRNAILYHFFDITKGQQVTDDAVPLELYRLWRKTGNTEVIPSLPSENFTIARTTYALTPEQKSRYAELVGTRRREIVDELVVNQNWHQLPEEAKIRILKRAYDTGMDVGKALFFQETEGQLEEKSKRKGFE